MALCLTLSATPADAGSEPEEPEVAAVIPANEAEHAKIVAAAEKAVEEKDDELLANVLFSMRERRHDDFVPVIVAALGSKDTAVLAQAVRAATAHELVDQEKAIRKLFGAAGKKKKKKKKKKGEDGAGVSSRSVESACMEYFAVLAIEGLEESVLERLDKLFTSGATLGAWATDYVRAAVMYLGRVRYMPAVPRLVFMLREPYPENVNSPTNPPESYWRARHEVWTASEGWIRWALHAISGMEFRTYREWAAWASANKKKFK